MTTLHGWPLMHDDRAKAILCSIASKQVSALKSFGERDHPARNNIGKISPYVLPSHLNLNIILVCVIDDSDAWELHIQLTCGFLCQLFRQCVLSADIGAMGVEHARERSNRCCDHKCSTCG